MTYREGSTASPTGRKSKTHIDCRGLFFSVGVQRLWELNDGECEQRCAARA